MTSTSEAQTRRMIDGLLNRIMVTNDTDEIKDYFYYLYNYYLPDLHKCALERIRQKKFKEANNE